MRDPQDHGMPTANPNSAPAGITAIGVFWFFGATMAAYAGVTLLWPGTVLDELWKLNPIAHAQLLPMGRPGGILFLALSATLATAGIGWAKRRSWGWTLGVILLAAHVIGDLASAAMGDWRGGAGVLIAGALLFYLFRPGVRRAFGFPLR